MPSCYAPLRQHEMLGAASCHQAAPPPLPLLLNDCVSGSVRSLILATVCSSTQALSFPEDDEFLWIAEEALCAPLVRATAALHSAFRCVFTVLVAFFAAFRSLTKLLLHCLSPSFAAFHLGTAVAIAAGWLERAHTQGRQRGLLLQHAHAGVQVGPPGKRSEAMMSGCCCCSCAWPCSCSCSCTSC